MAEENKNESQGTSGNNNQNPTFDPKNYNNDPNNMANYTGNFGAGTYDTDYGEGEYPKVTRDQQGDNWIDRIGGEQQDTDKQQQQGSKK